MRTRQRTFLSGLGAAEETFGIDEEAEASGAGSPSGGSSWDTVVGRAVSALPGLADSAVDAYRTYEEAHGRLPHRAPAAPSPTPAPAHDEAERPWYESPGFLIVASLGLGIVVVIATRRK